MPNVLILYASTEGQTARIADRIAQTLRHLGHQAEIRAADDLKSGFDPAQYGGIILGAAIHYGHHPAYLRPLVRRCRDALESIPSAFFSVSLSGGGPGAKPEAARRYLDVFLRQVAWHPEQAVSFGGALQFSKYAAWKRMLMVMIVVYAGGDTDTARDYEYTDWAAVEAFSASFAKRLGPS